MNYRSEKFEIAALTLGIISVLSCTCLYASIPCGALAILFALLSKGGTKSMSSKAVTGLTLGVIGLGMTFIFYGASFYMVMRDFGSLEELLRYYCDVMNLDFDSLYGQFL
ncbi:MAG: hypothetical protein SOZ17_08825 [Agathobacter sp.]|nr:hypothetical protein [Agathobacter sp.]